MASAGAADPMTKLSRVTYRVTVVAVGLAAVATFVWGRARYEAIATGLGSMDPSAVQMNVVMASLLDTPILLAVIAVALALRSGAAVWLAGWAAFEPVLSILGPVLVTGGGGPALVAGLPVAAGVILVAALLAYLVRSGELRRP